MTLVQFLIVNLGALITALGGIFLKRFSASLSGANLDVAGFGSVIVNPNLWLGGVCYVLPIFFWAFLLRSMDLTKLQPLLSIVYVYTAGLAYVLLGEQLSLQRIVGIAIVVFGVVIVGRS